MQIRFAALVLACMFAGLFAFTMDAPADAATTLPTRMNFQGRLANSAGNIVANGTYNMRFKIYTASSGGTQLWSEDRLVSAGNGVTVTNGQFSVQLGSISTLNASVFSSNATWFEVELPTPATATTTSPSWTEGAMGRNQIATTAYAYNAETLDGIDGAAFAQLGTAGTFTAAQNINVSNANAFQVRNGSTNLFNVDTSTSQVTIGTSDTTAAMLVLDTKTSAGDPTGVNGGMYYNSNAGKFRCYQNGAWTDCIGAGGGGGSGTMQDAYTNSGTPATITTTSSTKTLLFKAGATFDSTALFDIQDASALSLFSVDSTNDRIYIGSSTADSTGVLLVLDTKNNNGDPAGVNGAMYYNSSLGQFRCYRDGAWEACGTKPIDRGYSYEDDFFSGATSAAAAGIGNLNWQGTTIGTACGTLVYNNNAAPLPTSDRPGILRIPTSATTTTGCRLHLGSSGTGTLALAAGQVYKSAVAVSSTTANAILMRTGADGGTVNSATAATTSGVWWEANPATSSFWQYCYATGSATTCAASTVAIAANTFVRTEIRINATGNGTSNADFVINGNTYNVSGATINTSTLVRPSLLCTNGTTAATVYCYADYYQLRGDASAAR